jgi:hypothetical protein
LGFGHVAAALELGVIRLVGGDRWEKACGPWDRFERLQLEVGDRLVLDVDLRSDDQDSKTCRVGGFRSGP